MICVIAMIVFGILGVFSAKYRVIAKEATSCVFRRVTLRKCDTGLDKRLKNQITGKLGKKHPKTAKFLFKYFEVFSWIMIILFVWSIYATGVGVYNYAYYGSCIAPGDSGVCLFNLQESLNQYSTIRAQYPDQLIYPIPENANSIGTGKELIMFGCFTCPYTIQAESQVRELVKEFNSTIEFVFVDFPILSHRNSFELTTKALCAGEQDKYFEARTKIYDEPTKYANNDLLAQELNLNQTKFNECLENEEIENRILANIDLGINAHVKGTPTFYFEGNKYEGIRAVSQLRELIENN